MDVPNPIKRDVISITARYSAPLGAICQVTILFKILFQDICELKMNWDKPLTGELLDRRLFLVEGLNSADPPILLLQPALFASEDLLTLWIL